MSINIEKKVIIYGDKRYIKDFLYLFDEIKPYGLVDDIEHSGLKNWKILSEERKDEIFVIICKYNERDAIRNLESIGLEKGLHYASASTYFKCLDFPIEEISEKRAIYVWGTGDRSHLFFHEYIEKHPNIEVVGCIDNDKTKQGKTFFRRPIFSPEEIIEDKNAFYIIASTLYYAEIKEYLFQKGKIEGEDFIQYYAINNWASWMARETIYDVPRLGEVCSKPFKETTLLYEGRMYVCAGIPGMVGWNMPIYYSDFTSAWHSNVMKVIRLSVINGTYSFCNTEKCNMLCECQRQEIDTNEWHYHISRSKEQINHIAQKELLDKNTILCESNYMIKEDDYPEVVMCAYDKTCNLYCESCRSEIYTAKGKEKEFIESFTQRMEKELFPYIERLKVAGDGEAFASNIYKRILFEKTTDNIRKVGILSNGSLFDKTNFEKLEKRYDEIHVFISMDGATKETAVKLRRGINFDKWIINMKNLAQMRKENRLHFLAFNFVVQRENYEEMVDFARMCLSYNADQIKFSRIFNWGQYTEEEYEKISMFDSRGVMKKELEFVLKDEVFNNPKIKLFQWVDW